jgi:hypothetical protein
MRNARFSCLYLHVSRAVMTHVHMSLYSCFTGCRRMVLSFDGAVFRGSLR